MPLNDLTIPVVADNLAKFGPGTPGSASRLNYDVALPGTYSWDRIVTVDIPAEWFEPAAGRTGASLLDLGIVQGDEGRLTGIDSAELAKYYRTTLPAVARPSLRSVAEVGGQVNPLLNPVVRTPGSNERATVGTGLSLDEARQRDQALEIPADVEIDQIRTDSFLEELSKGQKLPATGRRELPRIALPTLGVGHSIRTLTVDPVAPSNPTFALVETWELRSFLGDYGLGRTLQTFSLLPGERTTIATQTWRSEATMREDASSVFDSSDSAAQTRFTSAVSRETGAAFQDQGGWALSASVDASAGGSLGIVSGRVDTHLRFAASHQESSQRWSNQISRAASEHVSQVNNSRRQSVSSTSATSTAAGLSSTVVREITNTNLRRVLNFVFRELNQTYETYVVLRDIKIAFYNGRAGSLEIVPLSDVGRLVQKHIRPGSLPAQPDVDRRQEVAARILSACAEKLDHAGGVVKVLQKATRAEGIGYDWQFPELADDGRLASDDDVLDAAVHWRVKPGPLLPPDQPDQPSKPPERTIDGVIMSRSSVVLRTDNLVVEALLGQADALDPYAAAVQALELNDRQSQTRARDVQTQQTEDALALVAAQSPTDRISAWQKVFPDEPEIQVVPVAAVTAAESNGNIHA